MKNKTSPISNYFKSFVSAPNSINKNTVVCVYIRKKIDANTVVCHLFICFLFMKIWTPILQTCATMVRSTTTKLNINN